MRSTVEQVLAELQSMLEDAGAIATDHEHDRPRAARMIDARVTEAASEVMRIVREEQRDRLAWAGMRVARERGEA